MLIVYRKSDGLIASCSGTNSYLPDGPPFELEVRNAIRNHGGVAEDYGGYRLNDNEQAETVAAVLAAGSYELTFDEARKPCGVTVYERLSLTCDKAQVAADDADTATITATIDDTSNTDPVTFAVEGVEPIEVVPTDGVAFLDVSFGEGNEGRKTITATHPRFGRNEAALEVVGSE